MKSILFLWKLLTQCGITRNFIIQRKIRIPTLYHLWEFTLMHNQLLNVSMPYLNWAKKPMMAYCDFYIFEWISPGFGFFFFFWKLFRSKFIKCYVRNRAMTNCRWKTEQQARLSFCAENTQGKITVSSHYKHFNNFI